MKRKNILFAILVIFIYFKESLACFSYDQASRNTISVGSSFYQECQCTEQGYNVTNLKWLDINDEQILGPGTKSNVYTEVQDGSISLLIPHMSKTLSGTYKCVTEFKGKTYEQSYTIDAYDPLYFVNTGEKQQILLGKNDKVHCEARSGSDLLISWDKEQDEITEITNNEKYELHPDGLVIKNVTYQDAGTYKCTVKVVDTSEDVDKFITVEVLQLPTINNIKVVPSTTAVVGQNVTIQCLASGRPLPEYRWRKLPKKKVPEEAKKADVSVNGTWIEEENTIMFENISLDDQGVYECTAVNQAGFSARAVAIEVWIEPEIVQFKHLTAAEGSTVQIRCVARGRPEPALSVVFEGGENLLQGPDVIMSTTKTGEDETTYTVTFQKISRHHAGLYGCNASNALDFVTQEMEVTVLFPPYFETPEDIEWGWPGKTVNMSCDHRSNPPSNITWRYENNDIPVPNLVDINKELFTQVNTNQDVYFTLDINSSLPLYGVYQCNVKNSFGEAVKKIHLKEGHVPKGILNVSIMDVTATHAIFYIVGPNDIGTDTGPPVIGFMAQYDTLTNYAITDIHTNRTWAKDTEYRVNKLKPNSTYVFKFSAVNEVGNGPWTPNVTIDTLEKSIPTWDSAEITHEQLNENQMIKWTAAESNGAPVDYYVVIICKMEDSANCTEEQVDSTPELLLTNLQYNTTYFIRIMAHNSEGNSTFIDAYFTHTESEFLVEEPLPVISEGAVIGISVVVIILCLVLLDLLFLFWKRQGVIASCCLKKNKKRKEDNLQSRDKKGLLKDNGESADDTLRRRDNGHKEYEYNKNTGVITGKHSAV